MTYHQLCEAYLKASESKASYKVYCRLVDQHLSQWTAMPTLAQIEDWHASLKATPHHANKGLNLLKSMFTWAIRRGLYVGLNPAKGIKGYTPKSREVVMSESQVGQLLRGIAQHATAKQDALYCVLLTTGCRKSEALKMEWTHVNLETGRWVQPTTKNGHPHITYLSTQARARIVNVPRTGPFVFMGAYNHHLSPTAADKPWYALRKTVGLEEIHVHDFRRTLSTHLYRHTKDLALMKRCLNHHDRSTTMIYVRFLFEEVAAALQGQADRFYALAHGPLTVVQATPYPATELSGRPVAALAL